MIDSIRQFCFRVGAIFRRRRLEAEMAEEMNLHIQRQTEANLSAGMSQMDARDDALRRFGAVAAVQEGTRDEFQLGWVENIVRDARLALRQLARNRAFAFATILTLSLGIGATIAVFTAADTLLFRPLPFREADRLVRLWETNPNRPGADRSLVSGDNFIDWKAHQTAFADLAAYYEARSVLYLGDHGEEIHVQGVTTNFFATLGVQPVAGRLFAPPAADSADEDPGLIISDRLWRTRFAGDPTVIGRAVRLDAISGVITGVAPAGTSLGDRNVDLWLPLEIERSVPKAQGRDLNVIARLKPGITLSQATAEMVTVARALAAADPLFNAGWSVVVESLRDSLTRNVRSSLIILLGAVAVLLAISCGNAATLIMARAQARRSETALRVALGAGRGRLVQQVLIESLVLAFLAGCAGLVLAQLLLGSLLRLAPQTLTESAEVHIDARIVVAALGLSLLTGMGFGLLPALFAAKADLTPGLKMAGGAVSVRHTRLRAWLIGGEIAASVILLTAGALLLRSLVKLQAVDPGLHAGNVLTFHCRVASPAQVGLFTQAIDRITTLPGVISVSATSYLPFDGPPAMTHVALANRQGEQADREPLALVRTVLPRYFTTIGMPLRSGRDFTAADNTSDAPLRFVVNEAFVRAYLNDQNPLGALVSTSMTRVPAAGEIIGVVGDVREGSLRQAAQPTVFYPYGHLTYGQMNLVVRTDGDALAILPAVRSILHELDPNVPIADPRTMDAIMGETYAKERFSAALMSGFSLSALLLAAVGIYAILAYTVAERTREIGIRLAIGASRPRVHAMIVVQAARFVVPGLLAGVGGSMVVTRLLSGLLYNISAIDPVAFLAAPTVLSFVALAAAYLPARRAASIDPWTALRFE